MRHFPPAARLRLLLGLLLLFFGVDQSVALAQEIRTEGETGHARVGAFGVRAAPGGALPNGPVGAAVLPAGTAELPEPDLAPRPAAAPRRRPHAPSRSARRREYPRGPPRTS
ncbi:MAG TPA: hypothetical protein VGR37_00920 [Longimicrobiaceae bacterium]|nr:hypothetical protein [Longimicrobiaceae bacterium]